MAYVLIIEDEPTVAMVLREALGDEGHEAVVESDGRTGLARLLRDPVPDIVLVDLFLPGMGGHKVVEAMRADPRLRSVPVVVVTGAVTRPGDLPAASSAVISKPFDLTHVVNTVQRLLDQSR